MNPLALMMSLVFASSAALAGVPFNQEHEALKTRQTVGTFRSRNGFQYYRCSPDHHWKLHHASANLVDESGNVTGEHLYVPDLRPGKPQGALMPAWKLNDGSYLTGEKIDDSPSPKAGAVAHLAIKVIDNSGARLGRANRIERLETQGGAAPAGECAANAPELKVPYSANYVFYDNRVAKATTGVPNGVVSSGSSGGAASSGSGAAH